MGAITTFLIIFLRIYAVFLKSRTIHDAELLPQVVRRRRVTGTREVKEGSLVEGRSWC